MLRGEDLGRVCPTDERLSRGPVVIVECVENIPCNPCVAACPKGAITIEGDINGIPVVDFETCDGCGICLSACPGLAIFGVDLSGVDTRGYLALIYAALVGTFSGLMLSFYNIKRFGATAASMPTYVIPVVASLGGALVLGERITPGMLVGMALIAAGIALINRVGR